MSSWSERLRNWVGEAPLTKPTLEVELGLEKFIQERRESWEDYKRWSQNEILENQNMIREVQRRELVIKKESQIVDLFRSAKKSLKPLYPSANFFESKRILTWRREDERELISQYSRDFYFIKFDCDGLNNRLSLIHGEKIKHFYTDEWKDIVNVSSAVIEAVKDPSYLARDAVRGIL